jgi:hypothetical protein
MIRASPPQGRRIPGMGDGEMPSEKVKDETGSMFVKVSWSASPTGHVQLVTAANDADQRLLGIVNDWLQASGQPQIKWETVQNAAEHWLPNGGFQGWHATLDRWSINQIIRNLRRARDAAFGKDE